MSYKEEADYNCETKTVTITLKENITGVDTKKLYEFLFNNPKLPKIQKLITVNYEADTIGYYSIGEPGMGIPYGRYFTEEELNGSNVVLLSDAYLSSVDIAFLKK